MSSPPVSCWRACCSPRACAAGPGAGGDALGDVPRHRRPAGALACPDPAASRLPLADHEPLLSRYPGAVGIKTGFTAGARYCLLFAARRGGQLLAGVVLDSSAADPGARFTAAARMLNWGFSQVRRSVSGP